MRWHLVPRVLAAGLLLFMLGALGACAASKKTTKISVGDEGFVEEVDEPGTRGRLSRVTPDEIDARNRFDISQDGSRVVFAGRRVKETGPGGDRSRHPRRHGRGIPREGCLFAPDVQE